MDRPFRSRSALWLGLVMVIILVTGLWLGKGVGVAPASPGGSAVSQVINTCFNETTAENSVRAALNDLPFWGLSDESRAGTTPSYSLQASYNLTNYNGSGMAITTVLKNPASYNFTASWVIAPWYPPDPPCRTQTDLAAFAQVLQDPTHADTYCYDRGHRYAYFEPTTSCVGSVGTDQGYEWIGQAKGFRLSYCLRLEVRTLLSVEPAGSDTSTQGDYTDEARVEAEHWNLAVTRILYDAAMAGCTQPSPSSVPATATTTAPAAATATVSPPPSNPSGGPLIAPIKLYWNAARGDNFSLVTDESERDAQTAGYQYVRVEGYVYYPVDRDQRPQAVPAPQPLKLFYGSTGGDYFTTATTQGEADALAAGYTFVRVEGWVFPDQQAGTVPLKLYWSDARGDNFITATAQGEADALAAGYRYVRVEGYVYPTPPAGSGTSSGPGSAPSGTGGICLTRDASGNCLEAIGGPGLGPAGPAPSGSSTAGPGAGPTGSGSTTGMAPTAPSVIGGPGAGSPGLAGVTDVPSCAAALAASYGWSGSDAANLCQTIAAMVPPGQTFAGFFGCIANGVQAGTDPMTSLVTCSTQPSTTTGAGTSIPTGGINPSSAAGTCSQWNISGTWATSQENGYHVTFVLQQSGTTLTGTASLSAAEAQRGGYTGTTGTVAGTLVGNHVDVIVTWPKKMDGTILRGHYSGTVTSGAISGRADNPDLPSYAGISWSGTGAARCVR